MTGSPSSRSPATCCPIHRLDERIATAFHRNTMTNTEGGTDDEEFRVAAIKDRVDTTMQVWMGLTMGCAKCHSHKFDPITQEEYYQFYAIFNQTADHDQPTRRPVIPRRRRSPGASEDRRQIAACEKLETPRRPAAAKRSGNRAWHPPRRIAKGFPRRSRRSSIPADKRTKPQAEAGETFRSIAPELKPVRDEIAALEKSNRRSRPCR